MRLTEQTNMKANLSCELPVLVHTLPLALINKIVGLEECLGI